MSSGQMGPDPSQGPGPASEEELRAAYEAEIKRIRVEQVLLEQIVTLINLGMRRTGLTPGTEDERDLEQVRLAIEAVRLQLPLIEQTAAPQAGAIRDALSQLQMAFVRLGGSSAGGETSAPGAGQPGQAPPAGSPPADPGKADPGGADPDLSGPPSGPSTPGAPESDPAAPGAQPGEAGPAQRSGRLWIPGQ